MTVASFRSFAPSLALALCAALSAQEGQGGAATGPLAPEKYKDIQVLKDVPASEVDAVMEYFSAALGFSCANCHVRDQATNEFAFEKEHRMKNEARDMIRLVQTVNGGDFGARINCGTCHQGHSRPQPLPAAQMLTPEQVAAMAARNAPGRRGEGGERGQGGEGAEGGGEGPGQRRGEGAGQRGGGEGPGQRRGGEGFGQRGPGQGRGGQPAEPILDKYVAAIGGKEAITKLSTKIWKGTVHNRMDQTMPFAFEAAGDRFRSTVQDPQGAQAFGFDGEKAWFQFGKNVWDLEGYHAQLGMRLDDRRFVADFAKRCTRVTGGQGRLPAKTPGGPAVTVNMVRGEAGPGLQERLYFDTTSGLLLRRQIIRRTPLNGALVETIDFSDYREVDGVQVPHTVQYNNWDRLDVYTVTDVQVGVEVADTVFERPKG
ncbi:MAG: photosynthetic reaction center cytochrome c subunit family protein [Planctomycetota bacterium]